ncbi:MAG: hypothetical protein JF590_08510, partial [Gemmatimonadetes bacterium]|nr:hypothetical protein [Gemmatimonadota bacterium]
MPLRLLTFGPPTVRDGNDTVAGAAAQPRRLALLALLARAGDRGLTRDKVVGVLWPDEPDEKARRNLTHALYALRRDLGGEGAITGNNDLRLDPGQLSTDVADFVRARSGGDLEEAAALYVGPFLDGFHLPASAEFERWAERERRHFADECARVLEELAERAERNGDAPGAVAWWRRLAAHEPLEARIAIRLMRALAAAGDVNAALRHARIFETLMEQELDLPPDREVLALAAELKREGTRLPPPSVAPPVAAQSAPPAHPPAAATVAVPAAPDRLRRWGAVAAIALVGVTFFSARRHAPRPTLAVGLVVDHRPDTTDKVASAL